jgi:hypothetical protein
MDWADAMGIGLEARNNRGGATFTLRFPETLVVAGTAWREHKILIVDERASIRTLLKSTLPGLAISNQAATAGEALSTRRSTSPTSSCSTSLRPGRLELIGSFAASQEFR